MPSTAVQPAMRFLDPGILRSLENIELVARMLVEGMYASRHRSPFYGYSVEFVDYREYSPGDEPRTIDWKVLARTEKYFVKRFEMESNMNVVSLLDVSASMGYRSPDRSRLTKLEYGSFLAASLSYLVTRQQDSPGLVTFDREIRDFVPPKQGRRHFYTLLTKLESLQSGGETDLSRVLQGVAQRLRRRGIVVLVTDAYGEPGPVIDGIRHLRVRGHDVIVFQVLDPDELTFPFKALTSFRDMETHSQVMTDPLRQRSDYLARLRKFLDDVGSGCALCGADYRLVDTTQPIELVLRDYLLYRRQRAR
ncbi:MAG TPA: DUF58 domain-containing protein [Planctomycetota bacterium]|nr:DUF58 domain-containing protein [Planctomycetota bacterium]